MGQGFLTAVIMISTRISGKANSAAYPCAISLTGRLIFWGKIILREIFSTILIRALIWWGVLSLTLKFLSTGALNCTARNFLTGKTLPGGAIKKFLMRSSKN